MKRRNAALFFYVTDLLSVFWNRVLEMCLNAVCALRSKSNPFLVFWSQILDILVDFGDAFFNFAASFSSIFEGIEFDDDIWYISDSAMEMRDFKRDTLNAHNNFRTLHGCPPLAMSEELSNTAQAWADKLADRGILQYSENPNVGENICLIDMDHLPSLKGEHVVKEWYKEIDNYNYNDPGWKKGSYRVSQLLWKSTSEIGIGIGKVPGQNRAYVVVNYRPAGNNNMPGEFERNVLPPQKRRDDNVPPWKKRP